MASPSSRAGLKKALSPHGQVDCDSPPAKAAKLCHEGDHSPPIRPLNVGGWSQPPAEEDGVGPLTQLAAGSGQVAAAFCPTCGCYLADVCGASAAAAHVAACRGDRQAGAAGPEGGAGCGGGDGAGGDSDDANWSEAEEEGLDGGVEEEEDEGEACKEAAGEAVAEEGTAGPPPEQPGVASWLEGLGLSKYAAVFERAGADLSLLPYLSEAHLREMGVQALGPRRLIATEAANLLGGGALPTAAGAEPEVVIIDDDDAEEAGSAAEGRPGAGQQGQQGSAEDRARRAWERGDAHAQATASGVGSWRALATGTSSSIARFFQPRGGRQEAAAEDGGEAAEARPGDGIRRFFPSLGGAGGGKPKAPAAKAAGKAQPWVHGATGAVGATTSGRRRWGGGRPAAPQPIRLWQLVPGTQFVVDRFSNLPVSTPTHRHWFLTHFHADHYKGLTSRFDRGLIYCSPPTAALVRQQLRVAPARLVEIAVGVPTEVDGVRVTFLEANHCPGAVMILFEPPGRRPVLHSGDCRLTAAMQNEPLLQAVRGGVDLILDTTYCDPQYTFPSQEEVLQFSVDAVKAESFNPRTLFLFGSYTIGKERLFLEAARVLGRKVYVSVAKRKVLECLDLGPEYRPLLTTDDGETNLHAVPLWMVTQKHMAKLLRHYRGRFTNAVGFLPTGWTHGKQAGAASARGRRSQRGTLITYQVPYSEHSSFTELRAFVAWLQPLAIVPSVNSDGDGPKARALVALLLRPGGV